MKDFKYIWLLLLLILNSFGACSDDDPLMPGERPSSGTDPAPEEQVLHDGFRRGVRCDGQAARPDCPRRGRSGLADPFAVRRLLRRRATRPLPARLLDATAQVRRGLLREAVGMADRLQARPAYQRALDKGGAYAYAR